MRASADGPGEPDGPRLRRPDFIIGGAMKSGTSSLHAFLDARSDVFIPRREIYFFDLDDILQHPDFHFDPRAAPTFDPGDDELLSWYRGHFDDAAEGQLVGEDSTTYLASRRAPARIRRMRPDVRLIFLLRDPIARSYSHYWHLVRTRRVGTGFEEAMARDVTIVQRSFYARQLRRYRERFPAEQILCVLYEEMLARPDDVLRRVLAFLDLPAPDEEALSLPHANPGARFRSVRAELLYNRLTGSVRGSRYGGRIPDVEGGALPGWLTRMDRAFGRLNRERSGGYSPNLRPATRTFLGRLFRRENRGLEELAGVDPDRWWSWW